MTNHASLVEGQGITLLGDDIYSHQPMIVNALMHNLIFIFVCLPQSHGALEEWLTFLDETGEIITFKHKRYLNGQGEIWSYRHVNQYPVRNEKPAQMVNWCELTVKWDKDDEVIYHNSWVTNHSLSPEVLPEIAAAWRDRWKTESGNHNVLKNRGYHLEHNFGHGLHHLSMFLLTLNLLAFLFHTVLGLVDQHYQRIRQHRGTRRGFFQDLFSLTKYLLFEGWEHLLEFLLDESPPQFTSRTTNSS